MTDHSDAVGSDAALPSVDEFRSSAREWLAANLERYEVAAPPARDKTRENIEPERAIQRRVFDAGFAGITVPQEYGGQGLSPEHDVAFQKEARGYRMPDFGVAGATTLGPCLNTMLAHGSPEFLRRHVPKILAGESLWVQFFSEPEAGSDLAGIRTRASRDGERWLLNGSKIWSSGAHYADYGLCLARTNWDMPKHRGLTWFAVPTRAAGVTVERIKQITGESEFCQEFFDDVELTDADIVGEIDQGWRVAQTMLVFERGGGTTTADDAPVGAARIAPDLVALARRAGRETDPAARQLVARAHVNDLARRSLEEHIAARFATGGADAGIAAYIKLCIGTYDPVRSRIALEIAGVSGLTWPSDDEDGPATASSYLNGRRFSIAGGTNEIQRNGIGERVLGLPREPAFDTSKPFSEVLESARNWDGRVG
jgi:alkylation response protein AidB-like acyl-CoA dehydrogenase